MVEHVVGEDQRTTKKSITKVDLNQVWAMYNDSVEIHGVSFSMLLRTKQKDREAGCSESSARHWLQKIVAMYSKRAEFGMQDASHINLITDASRHSTVDSLVSVCYNTKNDIAVYAAPQRLRSSKFVRPGEIVCDSHLEKLLAQKKQDRLSGYRMCQAISNQLKHLTDGKLRLGSFVISEEESFALQPLSPGVLRLVNGVIVRHPKKGSLEDGPQAN